MSAIIVIASFGAIVLLVAGVFAIKKTNSEKRNAEKSNAEKTNKQSPVKHLFLEVNADTTPEEVQFKNEVELRCANCGAIMVLKKDGKHHCEFCGSKRKVK